MLYFSLIWLLLKNICSKTRSKWSEIHIALSSDADFASRGLLSEYSTLRKI